MKETWIIFKKELKSYFVSPLAYIVAFVFLFLGGIFFLNFVSQTRTADVGFVPQFLLLIVFLCPVLTIKLISEEKRSGTIELLLTSPISSLGVVLGKFFAALSLYLGILAATLFYVFWLYFYSDSGLDYGRFFAVYFGMALLGGTMISIGVFISSLNHSQVIAGIGSFGVSLFFLFSSSFIEDTGSFYSELMSELALLPKFIDFYHGILDIQYILFFLLWIVFSLLLANKALESHLWK